MFLLPRAIFFSREIFVFFWGIKIEIAVVKIMTVLQNLKCTFGWSFDYSLISGIIKIKGLNVCTLRVDAFKVGRLSQEFNLLFIVFAKICVFIKQNSFLSDMYYQLYTSKGIERLSSIIPDTAVFFYLFSFIKRCD